MATDTASRTKVRVVHNGDEAEFAYRSNELVEKLLKATIDHFHITDRQHLLSLFNEAGQELPDGETLKVAGVEPGDLLLLRPSEVKGG